MPVSKLLPMLREQSPEHPRPIYIFTPWLAAAILLSQVEVQVTTVMCMLKL